MYYYVNYKTFEHVHRTYVTYMRLEYTRIKRLISSMHTHRLGWFTWQLTVKVMSKIRSSEPICVILEIYSYIYSDQKNGMKFLRFETPCRWFLIFGFIFTVLASFRSILALQNWHFVDVYKVDNLTVWIHTRGNSSDSCNVDVFIKLRKDLFLLWFEFNSIRERKFNGYIDIL